MIKAIDVGELHSKATHSAGLIPMAWYQRLRDTFETLWVESGREKFLGPSIDKIVRFSFT